MKIEPLGDGAYILRDFDRPAYELAASLNASRVAGLDEAVASYDTVGLFVDPDRFRPESVIEGLTELILPQTPKRLNIPVCYELGLDLAEAAERLGISPAVLVGRHSEVTYRCFAIGFCPGFPYLGYVDERISGLARRPTPRVRVPPGSVAFTGRQTGIYPLERPGGWWLIGRTPLTIVDVEHAYFPIEAGDEVTFVPISQEEFRDLEEARL